MENLVKSLKNLILGVASIVVFNGVALGQVGDVLQQVGTLKGNVQFVNHPELGRTPANYMYLLFRRIGCRLCIVGVKTDIDGNYEVHLGLGVYQLYAVDPTSPVYDLVDPKQARRVNVSSSSQETVFNVDLRLRSISKGNRARSP